MKMKLKRIWKQWTERNWSEIRERKNWRKRTTISKNKEKRKRKKKKKIKKENEMKQ